MEASDSFRASKVAVHVVSAIAAVAEADPDMRITSMSCDPEKGTVDFVGDDDGKIAKRLPKWIKVEERAGGPA